MKSQKPASGITQISDGFYPMYTVLCECGNNEHTQTISVDVDHDTKDVSVELYLDLSSQHQKKSRFLQIWEILTKGYTVHQHTIIMRPQTAYNYGRVLMKAAESTEYENQNRPL